MSELRVCGQFALKEFRDKARGTLTNCCCEPGHPGEHVYCAVGTKTLWYMKEVKRGELKNILHVDLKSGKRFTHDEAQALFQYLEAVKELRAAEAEGT